MSPSRPSRCVGDGDDARVGLSVGGAGTQKFRDVALAARLVEHAGDREGRGGRAADAGPAVDQHRLAAVPACAKAINSRTCSFVGGGEVGLAHGNVVHAEFEMAVTGDLFRCRHLVGGIEQGDQMRRAELSRGVGHLAFRADIDRGHAASPLAARSPHGSNDLKRSTNSR